MLMDKRMLNLHRTKKSDRHFEPIEIGNLKVSIQASASHYCQPRETLPCSEDYEEFEVAMMTSDGWFHPEKDSRFSNCSWASYWSSYDDIASYVPREEVIKMLDDVRAALGK